MAYLGRSPSQGVRNRYYKTASGGETSISGALTGGTLTFTDGNYVDVNLNGVTLVAGTDYNTSTANTIAGLSALTANDVVEIVVYDVFSVFSGNVNSNFSVGGNLSVTGTTAFTGATTITGLTTTGDINFGDNDKAVFGAGNDLQIIHDGSNSIISDNGTGNLVLRSDAQAVEIDFNTDETAALFKHNGSVELYHDNSKKFETTSSGVDVTGTAVVDGLTCSGTTTIEGTSTFGTSSADTRFNFDGPNQYRAVFKHSGSIAGQIGGGGADELRFSNAAGATVATIKGGRVGIGQSSPAGRLDVNNNGATTETILILSDFGGTGAHTQISFNNTAGQVGTINTSGSGTTYNTTSDIRLKQDIEPLEATDKLMQMNPVSYAWKANPDGPRSMGFIAQEMQELMPDAVSTGDNDEAMMSMDYGRITPILVSALQDAHRKIEQLEQRIADMENN